MTGPPNGAGGSACPACGGGATEVFFELRSVPTNSCIVLHQREAALSYPRGDIDLTICHGCGLIFNRAFDPRLAEYSPRYEETQGWSPAFRRFHERLARDLVERYALQGGRVLEIGCGKGEFLLLLSEIGAVHGVGFDPGYRAGLLAGPAASRVRILAELYTPGHLGAGCDLVCCKMTLEHVARPLELLQALRQDLAGPHPVPVFFMVPSAERILADAAFEDVYYEHCNYFTARSLTRLLRRAGFGAVTTSLDYGGQYLCLHASAGASADDGQAVGVSKDELVAARGFAARVAVLAGTWRQRLLHWRGLGKRILLWGSGSKSLAFLQLAGAPELVDGLVDINPMRQGTWQPGTGLPILAPESLRADPPDVVVVMNPVYRDEIVTLLDALRLKPLVVGLGTPPG
jgi:SAM-dependent methyltransferase